MTALRLTDVSKRFGGLTAISGLNMEIPPGRITGLIGPNGAGKTTAVNLITGVFKLSSGSVTLGSQDLTTAPRHTIARSGIARTFQTIRLLKDATVLENILIGMYRHHTASLLSQILGLKSSSRDDARFADEAQSLLTRFGMERYASYSAGGLSYGDQRRVEIMRALALKPHIILLDEPVAGMNDVEAGRLGEIFSALAQAGTGLLLIEHNIRFVRDLCAHIYVLDGGQLIAAGAPDEIVNNEKVIASYLGDDDDT